MATNLNEIRSDIHRKASAFAEATVYTLNNEYLTRIQMLKHGTDFRLVSLVTRCLPILLFKARPSMRKLSYLLASIGLINWFFPCEPVLKVASFLRETSKASLMQPSRPSSPTTALGYRRESDWHQRLVC